MKVSSILVFATAALAAQQAQQAPQAQQAQMAEQAQQGQQAQQAQQWGWCKPGTYACLANKKGWKVCNTSHKWVVSSSRHDFSRPWPSSTSPPPFPSSPASSSKQRQHPRPKSGGMKLRRGTATLFTARSLLALRRARATGLSTSAPPCELMSLAPPRPISPLASPPEQPSASTLLSSPSAQSPSPSSPSPSSNQPRQRRTPSHRWLLWRLLMTV